MDRKYDIAVVVLLYNPEWYKTKLTINSILLQKNVKYRIVFADDGSKDNLKKDILDYLMVAGCKDYIFVENKENKGTVKNIISALKACKEKYIKLISPGDMLNGETILCEWIGFLEKTDTKVSFCNAIYYHMNEEKKFIPIKVNASPQRPEVIALNDKKAKWSYLICEDNILGASTLCCREVMWSYIKFIEDKIKYAEDFMYKIMLCDGVKLNYFDNKAILYEYGTGISTKKTLDNSQRMNNDYNALEQILCNYLEKDKIFYNAYKNAAMYKKMKGIKGVLLRSFLIKGWFFSQLKQVFYARKTEENMDMEYMNLLMEDNVCR